MSKKVYVDLSKQDVQDIINAYEKDLEKFNKQKEVLDKIKEKINKELKEGRPEEHLWLMGYYDACKDINKLLKEVENE